MINSRIGMSTMINRGVLFEFLKIIFQSGNRYGDAYPPKVDRGYILKLHRTFRTLYTMRGLAGTSAAQYNILMKMTL